MLMDDWWETVLQKGSQQKYLPNSTRQFMHKLFATKQSFLHSFRGSLS